MDIRPHRRLVVPLEPPLFEDLASVADFVGANYEHFGAVLVGPGALAGAPEKVFRRMCDSMGLKLFVDCRGMMEPGQGPWASWPSVGAEDAAAVADFVVVPFTDPGHLARLSMRLSESAVTRQLALTAGRKLLAPYVPGYSSDGVVCRASELPLQGAPSEHLLFVDGLPDSDLEKLTEAATASVRAGAAFVLVGSPVVKAGDPGKTARTVAEAFREFT